MFWSRLAAVGLVHTGLSQPPDITWEAEVGPREVGLENGEPGSNNSTSSMAKTGRPSSSSNNSSSMAATGQLVSSNSKVRAGKVAADTTTASPRKSQSRTHVSAAEEVAAGCRHRCTTHLGS